MSSSITQCPHCLTDFRVTTEQLAAHNGMVRCGRCSEIFNASEHLHEEEPSPQLNLAIALDETAAPQAKTPTDAAEHGHFIASSIDEDEVETLVQQIVSVDELATPVETDKPARKPRKWPWIFGSLFLLIVALSQALYFFRVELAAQLPGLKPALTSYCTLLKCTIPLPAKVELLSIESSDLAAEPQQPNIVTLSALLHNHADYIQAYPSFELSLTDIQDNLLIRRIFTPTEYLHANDNQKSGLGANREINIQLHLDSDELRPMGYKLLLFFPHEM